MSQHIILENVEISLYSGHSKGSTV